MLAAAPQGAVSLDNFRLMEAPVPEVAQGEFLVRTLFLSVAPVMRQYMIDGAGIELPLRPGDVIHGRGVGQIIESRNSDFPVGTIVHGKLGWQDHAISDGADDKLMFPVGSRDLPHSTALGVLGMTGFSAFVGLFDIGQPVEGETVVVSGAAGGVGSIAGQLAKIAGCRVIGIAGTPEKCDMLTEELGFDEAVNYRSGNFAQRLADATPDGIDVIFDNVGGSVLDTALARINRYARVVSCGRISQYVDGPNHALANWWRIGENSARMQGFFVYEYRHRFAEAEAKMADWIREGRLRWREDVLDGFDRMPEALCRLFEGRNLGKQVVRVADPLSDAELGL
ncbi:Putative NADP-dependent oxidoreductase YfmJ [Tsuneonella dongtanensis]|uniref:Putative NADP-dependent oxidoreductase YfmJ n=1 Tax=Tsuneonella dongtanensis TaxID=692370 RepID=A0A1B2AG10_9SPHN|nr:NADP-dependent oxidoreductase [Tsuneonella dongtanensis]ANY21080.1 Putative NADP-dependent oxidoreductase YfmJ [Tsuneonella dongtanensis]